MSSTKALLKGVKGSLDAHRYPEVVEKARKVLEVDAENYHARVFLGKALDELGQDEESQHVYQCAADTRPTDPLAWQGLISLFERQSGRNLDSYHEAVTNLAKIWIERDDKVKCQAIVDRYTLEAKKYGSRGQYKQSLQLLLPGNPIFEFLDGRIPRPDHTFQKLAEIIEAEERERANTEIGLRRTRLGARIEQVTADVKREILPKSPLEAIYTNIIDWTHDDDVRRQYEEKLLQHAYDTLTVVAPPEKMAKRKEVQRMAKGIVILKHPFLLGWTIDLEWSDEPDLELLDINVLSDFVDCFHDEGLSKIVRGFLGSEICRSPSKTAISAESDQDSEERNLTPEDRLLLMTEGLQDASQSILAHRLMGQYYLFLEEFESAVVTLRSGLALVSHISRMIGMRLVQTEDALNVSLALALIQYQSPRHHGESRNIFEKVLERKPDTTQALMGIGLIYEEEHSFAEAIAFFERIPRRNQNARIKSELAWCRASVGSTEAALQDLKDCLAEMDGSDNKTRALRSQTLYRIGMCLWRLNRDKKARKSRSGAYAYFLSSLQADVNFAPAYTILGIYYADYASDRKRAMKCFHKAFELSASELDAAYRLAKSFSEIGDWELVEVIAQRVLDSGKARPPPGSKRQPISWPFAALGVVQMNNQEYHKSIVSFQSALRMSPNDYHSWVGLGESYHYSGRYIAATRAFEHAQNLASARQNDSSWFTEYMLANVKKELGEYDDAVVGYKQVLESNPKEFGACLALSQTLVERAARYVELGLFGRATDSAEEALVAAKVVLEINARAFDAWKVVGDACSVICNVLSREESVSRKLVRSIFDQTPLEEASGILADLDGVTRTSLDQDGFSASNQPFALRAALLAYKCCIVVSVQNKHAKAVSWYNLGWAENMSHNVVQVNHGSAAPSVYKKAEVFCFKRAIELEAGNAEFWNSLGIATCDLSPKVSQHAFVRSLFLNDKNARVWANLGSFYLLQGDLMLANESFTRAQSVDPAYAHAWLGQGFLAAKQLQHTSALQLFAHAYEIADSSSTLVKKLYSKEMFDHATPRTSDPGELLQPLLASHQLCAQQPADLPSQHLSALLAERVGDFNYAASTLELVCSRLEVEYENSESPQALLRFAQAKADLARLQMGLERFELAEENATVALDLLNEEANTEVITMIRLSAHMTAGLANAHSGAFRQAMTWFKQALAKADGNTDIIFLLSQVLWAAGGQNERDVAKEQLLTCTEDQPPEKGITTLLGAMSILDEESDTTEAVTADLEDMFPSDDLKMEERGRMMELLTTLSLVHDTFSQATSSFAQMQTMTMLSPSQAYGWREIAEASAEIFPAEAAILTAQQAVPPKGDLEAADLSRSLTGSGRPEDAQRAIMVAPFDSKGWASLM